MLSATDLAELQASFDGRVLVEGSLEYTSTFRSRMVRFEQVRPQAIAACESPADVGRALLLARVRGAPFAVRSGGHCFAGRSTTDGLLIDVGPMRAVDLDEDGVATVGAGARLGEIAAAIEPRGVTVPAGLCPDVGVAGLTLGGGFGLLGRKYGLMSDRLLAARVVLADGRVLDCDAQHNDDLFWALRGAGLGQFGVVTSFAFETLPAPDCTAFHLVWDGRHAVELADAWQQWAPVAPDELAASILVSVPADPAAPPFVTLFGVVLGGETEAKELLGLLVGGADWSPTLSERARLSWTDAKRYVAERAPVADSWPMHHKSEFFRQLIPREVIAALIRDLVDSRTAGEMRELDFTPWGGAYNRTSAHATAFVQRGERFLLKQTATLTTVTPESVARARSWLLRSAQLLRPWGTGLVYPNFPDADLSDPWMSHWASNRERLRQVKAVYDPDDVFVFGARQSVDPC
jgi:FAD/FMN-containing dehydrogenase